MSIGCCIDNPPSDMTAAVDSVSNSDGTLTISPTTGSVVASLTLSHANTWTAAQTVLKAGIAATPTDGLILSNTTAATSGVPVQEAPALHFSGNVWNTTAVAANNTSDGRVVFLPVSGTTPSNKFSWQTSLNGASYVEGMSLANNDTFVGGATLTIAGIRNSLLVTDNIYSVGQAAIFLITDSANGIVACPSGGTASKPAFTYTGTVFTGGTATTTVPQILFQPTGTSAVSSWSTSGTQIGVNAVSGFAGNFLDFHVAGGASVFKVASDGTSTFQSLVASSNVATPLINSGGAIEIRAGNVSPNVTLSSVGKALFQSFAVTSGSVSSFKVITPAETGLTASTNVPLINFDISAISTHATGSLAEQDFVLIAQPTLAFAGASTATLASTVTIAGPPIVGTNATITSAYGLFVKTGNSKFGNANGDYIKIGPESSQGATLSSSAAGNGVLVVDIGTSTSGVGGGVQTARFYALNSVGAASITVDGLLGSVSQTQVIQTTGSPFAYSLTAAAHTTLTASTEVIDVKLNLARTVQFATGTITTQRAALIQAPTYAFVGASTITNAATLAITAAPVAGTNATITNPAAFWVQDGQIRSDMNSAVSLPAQYFTGTWFTGGSATTTKPHILIEPTGTTSTAWSTNGTALGINAASAYTGNLIDCQLGGTSIVSVNKFGTVNAVRGNFSTSVTSPAYTSSGNPTTYGSSNTVILTLNSSTAGATAAIIAQNASTTGNSSILVLTGAANTGQTASTEEVDVNFNLARTVQFATGALTTQRATLIQAPTYGFVGASTITNAATFAITGAPVAGTNATITTARSLWVQAGVSFFDGGAQSYRPINAQTGTTYTLVLLDSGKMVTLNNASAITLTVPTNASVAFPVGAEIDLAQLGAGQVTVAAAGGVTINSFNAKLNIAGQYAGATLKQTAADTWLLIGNLA